MRVDDLLLWQDAEILAINKPAGLASLPDGYDENAPHVRGILTPVFGPLWVVHRLDRDTSGVIVLARNAQVHRSLNTQFEHHTIHKTYHAICLGSPAWNEKTVRLPLRANVGHRHRTTVDQRQGKPAVTHFRVLQRFKDYCLLAASPETGRTHQIRAHLYAIQLPLAADELYGNAAGGPQPPIMGRMALHACEITLRHPVSGQALNLAAPYPVDFAQALERLRSDRQE